MSSNPDLPKRPTKPILPWKTRLSISLITALTDAACRPDGTLNRRLLSIIDFRSPPSSSSSVVSSDITVDHNRNLWFRLYSPSTSHSSGSSYCCGTHSHNVTTTVKKEDDHGRLPVVIFFHGGGFCFLTADARNYDIFCRRFAKEIHANVISVNYRLTPEHRFPSQYDDGFDVLKFLDENHSTVLPPNADITKIFLAGDSAGGNLAHHVAVRGGRNPFRVAKIIGLISMQPYFGGEERTATEKRLVRAPLVSVTRTDWIWKALLGEESDRDHYAVNVSGPNAEDISGLDYPDTIVFVGGFDPLQDWQRRYYEWLRESGKVATLIEYPNMIHAFHIFPELLESSPFIRDVKDFIDKVGKLQSY